MGTVLAMLFISVFLYILIFKVCFIVEYRNVSIVKDNKIPLSDFKLNKLKQG